MGQPEEDALKQLKELSDEQQLAAKDKRIEQLEAELENYRAEHDWLIKFASGLELVQIIEGAAVVENDDDVWVGLDCPLEKGGVDPNKFADNYYEWWEKQVNEKTADYLDVQIKLNNLQKQHDALLELLPLNQDKQLISVDQVQFYWCPVDQKPATIRVGEVSRYHTHKTWMIFPMGSTCSYKPNMLYSTEQTCREAHEKKEAKTNG